jgi:hypothetical protein
MGLSPVHLFSFSGIHPAKAGLKQIAPLARFSLGGKAMLTCDARPVKARIRRCRRGDRGDVRWKMGGRLGSPSGTMARFPGGGSCKRVACPGRWMRRWCFEML